MRMPVEVAAAADLLARALLGDPDQEGTGELRWGTKGSLCLTIAGDKAGLWYDHEAGVGGNLLQLIGERLECDEVEALAWVKAQVSTSAPGTRPPPSSTALWMARRCSGCCGGRRRRRSRRSAGTRTRGGSSPGSTASTRCPTALTSGTITPARS